MMNNWVAFVKQYMSEHKTSYKTALAEASKLYEKKPKGPVLVDGLTWLQFVKKVRADNGCTYKEAMKLASPLWQQGKMMKKETSEQKPVGHAIPKVVGSPGQLIGLFRGQFEDWYASHGVKLDGRNHKKLLFKLANTVYDIIYEYGNDFFDTIEELLQTGINAQAFIKLHKLGTTTSLGRPASKKNK
jgi:hypothetical protein